MWRRKQYKADFEARVALGAPMGEETIAELASQFGVHPMMIYLRKRQLLDGSLG